MVRDGEIDTLVVALTDMQGRLMGKRVQAQAFLNGVIDHGAHFCTYLLGTDMEMNTPDGFKLMNWETGYGDWIAAPVWDTLRVLPWLEKTAHRPVATRSTRRPAARSRSRRGRSSSARSRGPPSSGFSGQGRLRVRVLRPARHRGRTWPSKGYVGAERVRLLQRGLPPAPGDQGRAAPPPAPQPDDRGRHPDRVQQGRGGARPARGQHPLRRRPRVGRPERPLQARRQGDRLPQRLGPHLHGQARPTWTGSSRPPPHVALGPRRRRSRCSTTRRPGCPTACRQTMRYFLGGMMAAARASWPSSSPRTSTRTSATRSLSLGAGQRGLGPRQPHDRLPRSSGDGPASTSRTASRAAT